MGDGPMQKKKKHEIEIEPVKIEWGNVVGASPSCSFKSYNIINITSMMKR
jgi:hypothetical protein